MADTNRGSSSGHGSGGHGGSTGHGSSSGQQGGTATMGQKGQETATNLGQRAQEMASNVGQRAQEMASSAGESALSSVGQGMSSLAGSLRQNVPHEGFMGGAADTVAQQLQAGGRYLQEHDLGDIASDISSLIRSHPMPAVCVAFGIGWLIGMASRR